MKRIAIIVLAAALALCAACTPVEPENVNVAPADIEAAISSALGEGYLCDTAIDADRLADYYGLDMSKVEGFAAKENAVSSVYLDTVVILEVADGYADEAVEAFNAAFAQSAGYVRMYPFDAAKVLGARIFKSGNYVAYIIAGAAAGEDATAEDEARLASDEYAKVDAAWQSIFGAAPENLAVVPEDDGGQGGMFGGLIGG
ncbi:MAG: DUF4358 domain-containing protein [Clostridia bacterium]|nr:DUF4358 domain-containing protein [Clostridia bacterium]